MQIDTYKCVACSNCLPVCPMGAITIDPDINRAVVNQDECVECHACYRGMSKEHLFPPMVLGAIEKLASQVETVISVGVSTRCDAQGNDPLGKLLEQEGYPAYWGKTNLGLGAVRQTSGR